MEENDSGDDFLDIMKIPILSASAIKTESNQTICTETRQSVNDQRINTGTIVKCEDNGNKRRRTIHLSTCECFSLAQSNDGAKTLSNPLGNRRNQLDTNKGLYPRHRTKKSTVSQTCVSTSATMSSSATNTNHSQKHEHYISNLNKNDFVSAKVVHVGALQNVHYVQLSPKKKPFKRKNSFDTCATNNSILNYFEKSPVKAFDEEMPSPTSSFSLMYSPIKQMSGSIYISDSPLSESDSSNARSQSTPTSRMNIASKRLFDVRQAASSEQAKIKTKKTKRSKKPAFDQRQHTLKQDSETLRLGSPLRDPAFEISDTETDLYENLDLSSLCKSHLNGSISSDKYGLLGTGTVPLQTNKKSDIDYFSQLPTEVIENIFCQLPMLDLCLNSNRVCTRWSCIISDVKVHNTISINSFTLLYIYNEVYMPSWLKGWQTRAL